MAQNVKPIRDVVQKKNGKIPPIVKHVLASQNKFGMPKNTWSNYKRSGIWVDPPPCFFKIPTFSRYFFLATSLKYNV